LLKRVRLKLFAVERAIAIGVGGLQVVQPGELCKVDRSAIETLAVPLIFRSGFRCRGLI